MSEPRVNIGERWTLDGLLADPPPPDCEFVMALDFEWMKLDRDAHQRCAIRAMDRLRALEAARDSSAIASATMRDESIAKSERIAALESERDRIQASHDYWDRKHDALAAELATWKAATSGAQDELFKAMDRVRELEAALRNISKGAKETRVDACPYCGGTKGHWEGCKAPVETKAEFCDRCERPLVNGKCPSPRCSPETDGNHG